MKRILDYKKLAKHLLEYAYYETSDTYKLVRFLVSEGYDTDELVEMGFQDYLIEEAMTNDMNNEY